MAEGTSEKPAAKPALNPQALTVEQAAKLLGVPEKTVREHVNAGAPTQADRLNLVHYAAWLNQQLKRRSDGPPEA